ncbi:MAG: LuxR C-terminal-related transcriptional regulator [Terrimicrobiaceae bacterium]|nr:LuxR C-terminal-related transcriptional regulator [Terrimicrobiaceae bacterium]
MRARNAAVAHGLGISTKTVETHQQRIKAKLGLRSGGDLKRCATDWLLTSDRRGCQG